jgi:hypothetical protein
MERAGVPSAVHTLPKRLVLPAVLALAFACRLDKLINTPPPLGGLGVAPSRVAASAPQGDSTVRSVALVVSSARAESLSWTAHRDSGAAWLVLVDSTGASPPDTISVTLHPNGLQPGIYRDAIIFVPNDSSVASVRVPVELRIDPVAPSTGTLTVTTSTTGSNVDPDGYTVAVDAGTPQAIATNTSTGITFTGLSATRHTVVLSGIASNCTVTGGPSQTKTVIAGQTVTLAFTVTCAATPPPTGDLTVTTSTSGSNVDPDGYTVAVDGGTPQAIAINNPTGITFTGLTATSQTVVLSGVAGNCTVTGGPSQTKIVIAGQTVTLAFTVTCAATPPPTGDLTVTTSTTGSNFDPNGYTVAVDAGTPQAIASNNPTGITFTGLTATSHTVVLGDVASNCTVTGGPSQTKTVIAGQTVTLAFTVTCAATPPPTGDLTVSATTSGGTPDPNGYTVTVDGGQLRTITNTQSATYTLTAGSHTIQLGDLASNCSVVNGQNPRSVNVPAGSSASTTFNVDCPSPPPPPPPPATHLEFTQQPPGTPLLVNGSFSVTVTALNDQGGVATGFTGLVRVTLLGPVVLGGLEGTKEVPAINGVARFTNLRVTGTCTLCRLEASASGLTGATSSAFTVIGL